LIGEKHCSVQTTSSNSITCQIEPDQELDIGKVECLQQITEVVGDVTDFNLAT